MYPRYFPMCRATAWLRIVNIMGRDSVGPLLSPPLFEPRQLPILARTEIPAPQASTTESAPLARDHGRDRVEQVSSADIGESPLEVKPQCKPIELAPPVPWTCPPEARRFPLNRRRPFDKEGYTTTGFPPA